MEEFAPRGWGVTNANQFAARGARVRKTRAADSREGFYISCFVCVCVCEISKEGDDQPFLKFLFFCKLHKKYIKTHLQLAQREFICLCCLEGKTEYLRISSHLVFLSENSIFWVFDHLILAQAPQVRCVSGAHARLVRKADGDALRWPRRHRHGLCWI